MAALLSVEGITKRFGATLALDHVSFALAPGEVHALVGENGAGKTTLMNVVSGVSKPDSGTIVIDGSAVAISSPRHAQELGIATVFQELSLAGTVSIGENIFAGRAPSRLGLVGWPRLYRDAAAILAELGVQANVRAPLAGAPISMRQMVEIAKAISVKARILLLDEPTAALSSAEAARLFEVITKLKARGIGVVYVSHHLSEVLAIADRITVLRDGRNVAMRRPDETSQQGLVSDMVGRAIVQWERVKAQGEREVLLEARGLSRTGEFRDVSLKLRAGEIVGLAGLMGSFRSDLGRTLCGILRPSAGDIRLRGRPVRWTSLAQAMRDQVAYIPEDRKTDGLFLDMSLAANVTAASLKKVSRRGMLSRARSAAVAWRAIEQLRIRARGPDSIVARLSGGNQQKALVAKWLETSPQILIVDEPTRGVDVGSKQEIHALLARLAERGVAILVISSDLIELMGVCNRIVVMHAGRIAGEIAAEEASEEAIVALASGLAGRQQEHAA
jgi:ribose transport system ATP-binding protein